VPVPSLVGPAVLTDVERYWFHSRLTAELADRKAEAFEQFFKDALSRRYPGDFMSIVPWGAMGDLGRDGFRSSTRTIFAMYSPHEEGEAKTRAKMAGDLAKAVEHWSGKFDEWMFVFPGRRGVPPLAIDCMEELRKVHGHLSLGFIDRHEVFRLALRELAREDLVELLGPPPSPGHVVVGAREVAAVLAHVSAANTPVPHPILPPPPDKIGLNKLSAEVEELLRLGRHRQHVVAEYLDALRDPEFGERLATHFRATYATLKSSEGDPNRVFEALQSWVGGNERASDTAYMFAVYAVLMYFFERCDIFERTGREAQA